METVENHMDWLKALLAMKTGRRKRLKDNNKTGCCQPSTK